MKVQTERPPARQTADIVIVEEFVPDPSKCVHAILLVLGVAKERSQQ